LQQIGSFLCGFAADGRRRQAKSVGTDVAAFGEQPFQWSGIRLCDQELDQRQQMLELLVSLLDFAIPKRLIYFYELLTVQVGAGQNASFGAAGQGSEQKLILPAEDRFGGEARELELKSRVIHKFVKFIT
jgi:hypothetical protein